MDICLVHLQRMFIMSGIVQGEWMTSGLFDELNIEFS